MSPEELQKQVRAAAELAAIGGEIALRWFRTPLAVANKADGGSFDPVTAADREVEAFLRAELARRYPQHRILGEEEGLGGGGGPWRWVVDPIDGTRSFMSGHPLWGVMIGLDDGERPLGGVVRVPFLRETFAGTASQTWLHDDRGEHVLHARDIVALEDAVLYCTHPDTVGEGRQRAAFERLASMCRMVRYGGDCYSYCLLALGQVDLVVEGMLQPYDVIPVAPIVQGAGGVISSWTGAAPFAGGNVVAAAHGELHACALDVLQSP